MHEVLTHDLTHTWVGYLSLLVFVVGYYFIAAEEKFEMNKAKPALFVGTFSFMLIGVYFAINNNQLQKPIIPNNLPKYV